MDLALIAQAGALASRIPFVHFFDGFRTSHEVQKVEELTRDDMQDMLPQELIDLQQANALSPPTGRRSKEPRRTRTSSSPRGARRSTTSIWRRRASSRNRWTGSPASWAGSIKLFDYVGHPEAERVVVVMGTGAEVVHETAEQLISKMARRSA